MIQITSWKLKLIKPNKIIIPVISFLIIIVAVIVFYLFIQNDKKAYIENLIIIQEKMMDAVGTTEYLTNLTYNVWNNIIHKKNDFTTNKFTIKDYNTLSLSRSYFSSYDFWSDFNSSLSVLSDDPNVNANKNRIKSLQTEINELMKKMQNPPIGCQNIYNDLDNIYKVFITYTNLALIPSGSLTSYSSMVNENRTTFIEYYNKIKLYIP